MSKTTSYTIVIDFRSKRITSLKVMKKRVSSSAGLQMGISVLFCWFCAFVPAAADEAAQLQAANNAIATQRYDMALKLLTPLAQAGNLQAQFKLAQMYELGYGVSQNTENAIKWYKLAARSDQPNQLSGHISLVQPNSTNSEELLKFIQTIKTNAQNGNSDAQRTLGDLYFKGIGVEFNLAQALKYYELSAAQQNIGAYNNLGYMYQYGAATLQDFGKARK